MKKPNELYFFVGTEAELMKLFPVINRAKERGYVCKIIASGQNDLSISPFLELINGKIDIDISYRNPKKKDAQSYLKWFFKTSGKGRKILKELFAAIDKNTNALLVVHGDTLTTAMGAWIAKQIKTRYVHIESGPRSFWIFSPFPEELDRLYGSSGSVINFCPGEDYTDYAKNKFKGLAVNTIYNTGIETLYYALEHTENQISALRPSGKYFMSMMHRQENLLSNKFIRNTVEGLIKLSEKLPCLFIYHQQTKEAFIRAGVFEKLEKAPNVFLLPKQPYIEFIQLVLDSEFVITDGCGNQQEFYYLGKPYLIMRTKVEKKSEGLGHNAKVFGGDFGAIESFYYEYPDYTKERIMYKVAPSEIIMNSLDKYFAGLT